jgi:hypothetical protein
MTYRWGNGCYATRHKGQVFVFSILFQHFTDTHLRNLPRPWLSRLWSSRLWHQGRSRPWRWRHLPPKRWWYVVFWVMTLFILKIGAVCSSETLISTYQTGLCYKSYLFFRVMPCVVFTRKMEAVYSSETLVSTYHTVRCHNSYCVVLWFVPHSEDGDVCSSETLIRTYQTTRSHKSHCVWSSVSPDSSVGTVTGLQATWPSNQGSILSRGKRPPCSPQCPDRLWGPPSLQWTPGTVYPRVKWLGPASWPLVCL